MKADKTPQHIKIDERNRVEKPLLDQLAGLGWNVIDLHDKQQLPGDTGRQTFTEVTLAPIGDNALTCSAASCLMLRMPRMSAWTL